MAVSNKSTKSHPLTIFYGLKAFQVAISVVAGAMWVYMLYQLMQEHQHPLGTFYFLTATVFVSILIVITTIFTVWLSGIQSPFVMVLVSLVLMIIWVANVVVLSNHLSNSESLCEDHSAGITICKLFKALFGMSITALTSSVVGLGWDLHRLWIASCGGTPQATKIKDQELEASEV